MEDERPESMRFFERATTKQTLEERTAHIADPVLRAAAIAKSEDIERTAAARVERSRDRHHLAVGKAVLVAERKTQAYIERMAKISKAMEHDNSRPPRDRDRDLGRDR